MTGSTTCAVCPSGYSSDEAANYCTMCPSGSRSEPFGACVLCPAGVLHQVQIILAPPLFVDNRYIPGPSRSSQVLSLPRCIGIN